MCLSFLGWDSVVADDATKEQTMSTIGTATKFAMLNTCKKTQSIPLLLIFGLLIPTLAAAQTPVDLSSWTPVTLDLSSNPQGNWILSGDNTSVIQTTNADPTFFLNNLSQGDFDINGNWTVETTNDDDFIGFVFGYQDPAHTYVFDWKQANQDHDNFGLALEGFCVRRIAAAGVGDLTASDYWASAGTEHTTILDSQFGTSEGWLDNTVYTFELNYDAGNFTIRVMQDQTVLWETTINDGTYSSGQFGFYNHSQDHVRYSGFVQNEHPVCDAGGPYFGDAGVPVQFDASGSFDPDGEIVTYQWDFGDGQTGSGMAPTHTYAADGEYNITLCITDNLGETSCCSPDGPVVPTDSTTWGELKSLYR
jgi:chitodextrinase